jgi:5-methylthioadenosine/S-adenosylhomocysteine deaminase
MVKIRADLIIHNGTILTNDDEDSVIENGAIAIESDRIVAIGEEDEIRIKFSATKNINARGGIILPGLINTHTHLAMSIFRGIADDMPLDEWLNKNIFPLEDEFINKNSAYWGSLLSCAEMILSGTTTFCDMYFFEKETGRAAEKIGIRGIIGEGIVAIGESDKAIWNNKKSLTIELLNKFKKSELISIGVEPHSPYTCSADVLRESKQFAKENKLLYIIHLAETKKEFTDFERERGMTSVEYLDTLSVLDENTLSAHCVWMSKDDIKVLKARHVKIAHCPQSNMKLGSGIAPVAKFLKNGVTVGLGTDGAASNNTLDMFSEMKSAALLAKVANLDPCVVSSRETLRIATIEGAKALGKEQEMGSLEIGKKADLIVIDMDKPHLMPVYDYYSHLVYSAKGSDVKTSVINGEIVMENRKLKNIDMSEMMKKVKMISKKISKKDKA